MWIKLQRPPIGRHSRQVLLVASLEQSKHQVGAWRPRKALHRVVRQHESRAVALRPSQLRAPLKRHRLQPLAHRVVGGCQSGSLSESRHRFGQLALTLKDPAHRGLELRIRRLQPHSLAKLCNRFINPTLASQIERTARQIHRLGLRKCHRNQNQRRDQPSGHTRRTETWRPTVENVASR